MKLLVISQVYWPDTASTAQHLADLCECFAAEGHEVTVFAGSRLYEKSETRLPLKECHKGVKIERIWGPGFGKKTLPGRMIDFMAFNGLLALKLLRTPGARYDAILGMTSPPLVSWIGVLIARMKGKRFFYWAMDLQPELAIQAGLLRADSWIARTLEHMGKMVVSRACHTFALDRFMAAYLRQKAGNADAVSVARLWPVVEEPWRGERLANPFRIEHGFGERFVVMYSGNHAVVHPLDTLLQAARLLRDDERFLFVFIGGGARVKDVSLWKETHRLENIWQLPYQPRNRIHISLSAADLHVVILGDGQVGYTHPNKVYGAMTLGRPFLYIGPEPSHVSDLVHECSGNVSVRHGEASRLAEELVRFCEEGEPEWLRVGELNRHWAEIHLNRETLQGTMLSTMTAP